MKKLKQLLEKCYEGKLPKGITQGDVSVLTCVYEDLVKDGWSEFFQQTVADVLIKCRIKVHTGMATFKATI